jgi:hypothetical protein
MPDMSNYTQAELRSKTLFFIKSINPKAYKQLKYDGELDEYYTLKANAARRYAEGLISSGEPDFIVCNRAIRYDILESESD